MFGGKDTVPARHAGWQQEANVYDQHTVAACDVLTESHEMENAFPMQITRV
jgi:hypothetical protein